MWSYKGLENRWLERKFTSVNPEIGIKNFFK
jgi:hypothetical protein